MEPRNIVMNAVSNASSVRHLPRECVCGAQTSFASSMIRAAARIVALGAMLEAEEGHCWTTEGLWS